MCPYAAAQLIGKVKNATPGMVIALYGVMRLVSAAFNVSFGGVAGFVRPVIMPMAVGADSKRPVTNRTARRPWKSRPWRTVSKLPSKPL